VTIDQRLNNVECRHLFSCFQPTGPNQLGPIFCCPTLIDPPYFAHSANSVRILSLSHWKGSIQFSPPLNQLFLLRPIYLAPMTGPIRRVPFVQLTSLGYFNSIPTMNLKIPKKLCGAEHIGSAPWLDSFASAHFCSAYLDQPI